MCRAATYHIGIVGAGPRGVVLLGQVVSVFRRVSKLRHIKIHLIDPNAPGIGCHPETTPDYLVTNTLAGDCTAFGPDTGFDESQGLSFSEWAKMQGYRWVAGRVSDVGAETGVEISLSDHIPRRLLGLYFNWCWKAILRECPVGLEVIHHRSTATALSQLPRGYRITLSDQNELDVNALVLSTGHSIIEHSDRERRLSAFARDHSWAANPPRFISGVYPVSQLDIVRPQEKVIVEGLGLTAIDAVIAMTVGRGGVFESDNSCYNPSGREPRILLYSRSGAPPLARNTAKERCMSPYKPKIFTVNAVRTLRRDGHSRLDFLTHVLPLLKMEMMLAISTFESDIEPSRAQETVDAFFAPFAGRIFCTLEDYRSQMREFLLADQEAAATFSPERYALTAVRSCYPAICEAVEHRGLSTESHSWYRQNFLPFLTRAVFSMPLFRARQLSSLIASGIVQFGGGPGAILMCNHQRTSFDIVTRFHDKVDVCSAKTLVVGRLPKFTPENDHSPLTKSLLATGLARAAKTGGLELGGFDVSRDDQLIGANGQTSENLWIVGYQSEGLNLFKHALPRTDRPSHHVFDRAARIARMLLSDLDSA